MKISHSWFFSAPLMIFTDFLMVLGWNHEFSTILTRRFWFTPAVFFHRSPWSSSVRQSDIPVLWTTLSATTTIYTFLYAWFHIDRISTINGLGRRLFFNHVSSSSETSKFNSLCDIYFVYRSTHRIFLSNWCNTKVWTTSAIKILT